MPRAASLFGDGSLMCIRANCNQTGARWVYLKPIAWSSTSLKRRCSAARSIFATSCLPRRARSKAPRPESFVPNSWRGTAEEPGTINRVQPAPRRSSQVLPPAGRMTFLTLRGLNDSADHLNDVAARLVASQRMGLAESTAPNTRNVRYDMRHSTAVEGRIRLRRSPVPGPSPAEHRYLPCRPGRP